MLKEIYIWLEAKATEAILSMGSDSLDQRLLSAHEEQSEDAFVAKVRDITKDVSSESDYRSACKPPRAAAREILNHLKEDESMQAYLAYQTIPDVLNRMREGTDGQSDNLAAMTARRYLKMIDNEAVVAELGAAYIELEEDEMKAQIRDFASRIGDRLPAQLETRTLDRKLAPNNHLYQKVDDNNRTMRTLMAPSLRRITMMRGPYDDNDKGPNGAAAA